MEKLLDWENSHLYNKLGLKWKLARQRCDSTLMMEYVSNYHNVNVIISTILFTLCLTKLISNYYQLHFPKTTNIYFVNEPFLSFL